MPAGDLITAVWQVEWRETLWGNATSYALTDLVGWSDKPALRGSNADRPGRHGGIPGRKVAEARTIEAELTVDADTMTDGVVDFTLLNALEDVCAYTEDPEEEDLVIWAGFSAPLLVRARLERAAVPSDHEWSVGHHRARLQWVATDPRRYSVTEEVSPVLGMPGGVSSGITVPVVFPVTFGTGVSAGSITIQNAGNAATWPTFTLTGPLSAPTITNSTTGQQLRFAPSYVLADGDTMVIDTDARSVTIGGGVSRRDALIVADWFPLPPREDVLLTLSSTGAYDASAGLVVSWRNAWL